MKLKKKIMTKMLVITMLITYLLPFGNIVLAIGNENELKNQNGKTNNQNVEFDSYFEKNVHEKTFEVGKKASIYLKIKVSNTGYLKNGQIEFLDTNFLVINNIENRYIQSIKDNIIKLKQINNNNKEIVIEVPIAMINSKEINTNIFSKISKVKFTGTYVDKAGKENNIKKEVYNKVNWNENAQVELKGEVTTYLPYHVKEEYGVLIQAKIQSGIVENKLPVLKTNLNISVPTLNGIKPNRINVIANDLKGTNGTEGIDFGKENYTYNIEKNTIEINTKNIEKDGKIKWGKGLDEYVVNYIFTGKEIYNKVNEQIVNNNIINKLELQMKANIEVLNNTKTILNKEETVKCDLHQQGSILQQTVKNTNKISKGYIYTNYINANKESKQKETKYNVQYKIRINDKNLINNLEIKNIEEKFIDDFGKEYLLKKGEVYNNKILINEKLFNKMLGQEGTIQVFTLKEKNIGTINSNSEKDKYGNYVLNISKEKTNQITLKTTPIKEEGNLTINIEKEIGKNQTYTKNEMKEFKNIKLGVMSKTSDVETIKAEGTIKLAEPISEAEIEVAKENKILSTAVENKDVEIRVVLDTSNYEKALYKNPVIEIELPENVEKVTLTEKPILFLEDELQVKDYKIINRNNKKVIMITLKGEQTKYMDNENTSLYNITNKNIITKGANIIVKANIKFNNLTTSKQDTIKLYYTNENTNLYKSSYNTGINNMVKGTSNTNVEVTTPSEIILENTISGYNGNETTKVTREDEKKEALIDINGTSNKINITGNILVNNNNVKNIDILGRTLFTGNKQIDSNNELGSKVTLPMISKINLLGIEEAKAKIYYTTQENATRDILNESNKWVETPSNFKDVKSYLIHIENDVASNTKLKFSYEAEIPKNLDYENNSYGMYKVYYKDNTSTEMSKTSGIVGITTGFKPTLKAQITTPGIEVYREGQYIKMKIAVSNNGSRPANDVKVTVNVPKHIKIGKYVPASKIEIEEKIESKIFELGTIDAGKKEEREFYVKIDDIVMKNEENNSEYLAECIFNTEVTSRENKKPIKEETYKMNISKGDISIAILNDLADNQILKDGDVIKNVIRINSKNVELTNAIITIPLPKGVTFKNAEIGNNFTDKKISNELEYDKNNNQLKINFKKLKTKVIILNLVMENFEGNVSFLVKAKADGTEENYSNMLEHKAEKIKLEVSQMTSDKKYVKENENVTYKFKITNIGNIVAREIKVISELPKELEFIKATYKSEKNQKEYMINYLTEGKIKMVIYENLLRGENVDVAITAKAKLLPNENDKDIQTIANVNFKSFSKDTNIVINTIEYNEEAHKQNSGNDEEENNKPIKDNRYKITGLAWVDEDKDGKRTATEKILPGIQVILINSSDKNIVKDPDTGMAKTTQTDSLGKYEFSNLKSGEYIVIFLYDAGKYNITKYQEKLVDKSFNSDANNMKITFNNEKRYAGVTNNIKIIDKNVRDIDIGMYEAKKFDLRLDKYISKITITTPTIGTKTYSYNNKKLIKQEILTRNLGKSNLVIEYKFIITNEGQISGYAKKIVDYLPEYTNFNTELNRDWYISDNNGAIYNNSLANTKINPGESKEIKLILTLNINEKNIGKNINNSAEIYESYNEQGILDNDSKEANRISGEDDFSNADIILGIVTGKIVLYITLTVSIILLLTIGIVLIKKKVLNNK